MAPKVGHITAIVVIAVAVLVINEWRYAYLVHTLQTFNRQPHQHINETEYHFHENQNEERRRRRRRNKGYEGSQQQQQQPQLIVVNEIIHRAFFGLGHRLHRSAAVYHLARSLSLSSQEQPIITHLRFHWESCLAIDNSNSSRSSAINETVGRNTDEVGEKNKEYNVFRYLFGEDLWELNHRHDIVSAVSYKKNDNVIDSRPDRRRNMIIIRNDIPGYISGQLYKDLNIPINIHFNTPQEINGTNTPQVINGTKPVIPLINATNNRHDYNIILDKLMSSDVQFYRRLVNNYRFRSELREFRLRHKWKERPLVVGLHLRAGNGERSHFVESGRAADDESVLVYRLVQLINLIIRETNRLQQEQQDQNIKDENLPPLLFIATDTAHLLPLIEKAVTMTTVVAEADDEDYGRIPTNAMYFRPNISTKHKETSLRPEIIIWPQHHLPRNAGVGFDALKGKGDSCLNGWKAAISDALLLSEVDVLIAAKRSTFTQSLPMTLGFDRNRNDKNSSNKDKDDDDDKSKEKVTNRKQFSFCEVSELDATRVTCVTDAQTWLFRGEDNIYGHANGEGDSSYRTADARIWTVAIPTTTNATEIQKKKEKQQVAHKITVLLPDIVPPEQFEEARDFLRRENSNNKPSLSMVNTETRESIFRYGRSKIYKKYRNIHNKNQASLASKSNSSWNLIYNT